ncbi:FAD binding domain-containing protein [Rhodothermus marinus]|uniref:FAD binding domain-containing protein n=1 Tax=Rhodothermus marinus TaxID=29549 RepID=UPI0037CB8EDA
MIPPPFTYAAPASLEEALALLQQHGPMAKILAGGHSLLPMMKLRLLEPEVLIDLRRVPGLSDIREENGYLHIGAMVREVELEEHPLIREKYPLLHETTRWIADPQVRNMGTVGGNLAHGDPGNDHPATMMAYDAQFVVVGPRGERVIPAREFFLDFYTTALEPDEILTAIRIPTPPPRSGGAYEKLERKVGDYAAAAVAVQLSLAEDGTLSYVGIGLTNVAHVPLFAARSCAHLQGQHPTPERIDEAARMASEGCNPRSDLRGSAEYKRAMVRELTRRAFRRALERAQGGQ